MKKPFFNLFYFILFSYYHFFIYFFLSCKTYVVKKTEKMREISYKTLEYMSNETDFNYRNIFLRRRAIIASLGFSVRFIYE